MRRQAWWVLIWASTLVVAVGLPAYALGVASVGTKHLKDGAVTSAKVRDGSLRAADFKAGQLPAGPRGETGAQGEAGPEGEQGPQGPRGDTGARGSAKAYGTVLTSGEVVDGFGGLRAATTSVAGDVCVWIEGGTADDLVGMVVSPVSWLPGSVNQWSPDNDLITLPAVGGQTCHEGTGRRVTTVKVEAGEVSYVHAPFAVLVP